MNILMTLLNQAGPVLAIIVVGGAIYFAYKKLFSAGDKVGDKPWPLGVNSNFLTAAEQSFYGVLIRFAEDKYVVCPKVNLSDAIFIKRGTDAKLRQTIFNKISRKHLDFLLLDPQTLAPEFAVELDDSSHKSATAKKGTQLKINHSKMRGLS